MGSTILGGRAKSSKPGVLYIDGMPVRTEPLAGGLELGVKVDSSGLKVLLLFLLAIVHAPLVGQHSNQDLSPAFSYDLDNFVNIEFRADIRIFAVMASLNAAGFDYEAPGKEMAAIRVKIRQKLRQLEPRLLERLSSFYEAHQTFSEEASEQAPYISLALLLGEAPNFKIDVAENKIPIDARQVLGFELLVREVYQQARLEELWKDYEAQYDKEMSSYRPVVKEVAEESLRYFRISPPLPMDTKIVLIPDLLNATSVVNARNLEHIYYIITGPAGDAFEHRRQIQHEYLHFLIDPLIQKQGIVLLRHEDLLRTVQKQPSFNPEHQNDFFLVVAESLIESIQLKLHASEYVDQKMVDLFRDGLILAPYFYRGLAMYENSGLVSLPLYVEGLLQGIGELEIEVDEKAIAALEAEIRTAQQEEKKTHAKALRQAAQRQRTHLLLKEAGELISKGDHEAAREKTNQILAKEPTNANALFYLAQIASQQRQFDSAFDYYKRAANSPNAANWLRAWCMLRVGNHLAFKGDASRARENFNRVIKMEGDLRGAREKAKESLKWLAAEEMK